MSKKNVNHVVNSVIALDHAREVLIWEHKRILVITTKSTFKLTKGAENEMLVLPPRIIGPFGTPSKFVLDALKSICAKFGAFFQSPSNHESIKYF